ncbi:MAG: TonB-dependent receptor [Deltaproteobacteria bacterium]|nr:TonB-dependent receptor [Deltaproteobacteria bacterium]
MTNKFTTPIVLLFIACLLFIPVTLWSQEKEGEVTTGEESIEDIFKDTKVMFIGEDLYTVSIASGREEPLRRAPAAVTVIAGEDLKKFRTLEEALAIVPGFFVDRYEVKNKIYLRGLPDSFLVMMDGVPFSNDTSTSDYPQGLELSLDYIEKIEIIRGPGSALWGADAFSGVVNLVTKKGKDVQGTIISSEVGTFNTQRYKLLSGYNKHGVDLLLSAAYSTSHDFEHNPPRQNRLFPDPGERKRDHFAEFYGKLRYKENLEISGRVSEYKNFFSMPRFPFNGEEYTPFSFLQVTYNKEIGSSSNLLLNAYLEHFENLQESDIFTSRNENWQYGWGGQYDFNLFQNHFITIGSSMKLNDGRRTKVHYKLLDTPTFTTMRSFDTRLFSLYFQDKYKITDNLELTAGVRYDKHNKYKRTINPRVGISWSFLNNFNLKLLYGKAFRTPPPYVFLYESNLRTEKIVSYEVELGYQYNNLLSLKLNFFYNRLKDLIEEVDLGIVRNRGHDQIKGMEFSAFYRPTSYLSIYANVSYLFENRKGFTSTISVPSLTSSEVQEINYESSSIAPRSMFHWGINYSFLEYLTANLDFSYYAKRELGENQFYKRTGTVSPYMMVDFNLFIKHLLEDRVEMSLKVRNVFDSDYHSRGKYSIIDGAGRGAYFSLKYKF